MGLGCLITCETVFGALSGPLPACWLSRRCWNRRSPSNRLQEERSGSDAEPPGRRALAQTGSSWPPLCSCFLRSAIVPLNAFVSRDVLQRYKRRCETTPVNVRLAFTGREKRRWEGGGRMSQPSRPASPFPPRLSQAARGNLFSLRKGDSEEASSCTLTAGHVQGLTGLQLLFDATVHQRQTGQELQQPSRPWRGGGEGRGRGRGIQDAGSWSRVFVCLEDSRVEKTPREFL